MHEPSHIFFDELSIIFSQERLDGYLSHAKCNNSKTDALRFKNMSSSEIKPEMYNKILQLCDKTDSNIESCLAKLKAQSSYKNNISSGLCCWNVSNQYGDYVNYQAKELCIPAERAHAI